MVTLTRDAAWLGSKLVGELLVMTFGAAALDALVFCKLSADLVVLASDTVMGFVQPSTIDEVDDDSVDELIDMSCGILKDEVCENTTCFGLLVLFEFHVFHLQFDGSHGFACCAGQGEIVDAVGTLPIDGVLQHPTHQRLTKSWSLVCSHTHIELI